MTTVVDVYTSILVKYPQFAVLPSAQVQAFAADALSVVPLSKIPVAKQLQALVLKTCVYLVQALATSTDGLKLKREEMSKSENEFFESLSYTDFQSLYSQLVAPYCRGGQSLNGVI